jgi:CubicO group peptidase (beta-lactamase class C family)
MELAEGMTAAGLQELAALTAGGLEHLMDPRMVNIDKIRHALLPSTNLLASAEALARTLAFVVESGRQNPDIIGSPAALKDFYTIGDTSYHGAAAYAAHYSGMRLFTFEKEAAGKTTRSSTGVGMGSLGGSVVFADTAKNVTVAITVNRLTSDRALSKHLLDIIAEDLQLGKLVDF